MAVKQQPMRVGDTLNAREDDTYKKHLLQVAVVFVVAGAVLYFIYSALAGSCLAILGGWFGFLTQVLPDNRS
ncbi:MAG: hypothetical protein NVS1B7_8040 [Candidatus Saccharimonadales bacterium]